MEIVYLCDLCNHTTLYNNSDFYTFISKNKSTSEKFIVYCGECGKEIEIIIKVGMNLK